jgi:uncharacterized membrane protein YccC
VTISTRARAAWTGLRRDTRRLALATGLRIAVIVVVPVVVGLATSRLDLATIASIGALNVALADTGGAARTRARFMAAAVVIDAVALFLGTLAGNHWWLAVPLMFSGSALGGLAGAGGAGPGQVGFVATVLLILGVGLPADASTAAERLWLAAAGGAWALLFTTALWPLRPFGSPRAAVAGCYRALGRLLGEQAAGADEPAGTTGGPALSPSVPLEAAAGARDALEAARQALSETRAAQGGESPAGRWLVDLVGTAELMLDTAEAVSEDLAVTGRPPSFEPLAGPLRSTLAELAALAERIADATVKRRAVEEPDAFRPALAELGGAVTRLKHRVLAEAPEDPAGLRTISLARTLSMAVATLCYRAEEAADAATRLNVRHRRPAHRGGEPLMAPPQVRTAAAWPELRQLLRFDSVYARHALRIGVVNAAGVAVTIAAHIERGYWITLSSTVILRPYVGATLERAVLRVIGTIVGGAIAALCATQLHNDAAIVVVLATLAVLAFSTLSLNYGAFVVFLTPLVVLLIELGHGGGWKIAGERVADTVIGAALALVGMRVLWPASERIGMAASLVKALGASRDYLGAAMACYLRPSPDEPAALAGPHRRGALAADNTEARFQRLLSEPGRQNERDAAIWRAVAANRVVYSATTALVANLGSWSGRHPLPGLGRFATVGDVRLARIQDALGPLDNEAVAPPPAPAGPDRDLDEALAAMRAHLSEVADERAEELGTGPESTPRTEELREQSLVVAEAGRIAVALRQAEQAVARWRDVEGGASDGEARRRSAVSPRRGARLP